MRQVYRSVRAFAQAGASFVSASALWRDAFRELLCAAALAFAVLGGGSCSAGGSGGSTGGGSHTRPGDTVGTFELAAPTLADFVLRGTLPVPPRTFPSGDGLVPLQVVDSDGSLVPAQVEIVSRYPAEADGADVVEVLAHVHTPSGTAPGDRIRYDVVYQPHPADPFLPDPDVRALLSAPGSLLLRTRDVFGNLYTADLLSDARSGDGSLRVLRNGSEAVQVATHASLLPVVPVGGPTGTLPHLMGVHAYVTKWADEPFFSLDLRIHDAHSGLDPADPGDDALGKLYFDSLELSVPDGWSVFNAFPDPWLDLPYVEGAARVFPIVKPISTGQMHVMPAMSQFQRRLVVVKDGLEARALACLREEGLGFCRAGPSPSGGELWSWWNPDTARYFPQRHRLPSLDHVGLGWLRGADAADLGVRSAQVLSGSTGPWPAQSPGLGWAHPWGITAGGMVSGLEIDLYEGVTTACAASNAGYRLAQLVHRMLSDRQPNVLFDADGRPTRMEEWVAHSPQGDVLPIWWFGGPLLWAADPFGITTSPSFQRDAVAAQGRRPDWEQALLDYERIDAEHLIRYTRMAKVLAWLGNDALGKDDLRAQAEGVRLGYNMYRQDHYPQGIISTGMYADRLYVDWRPGWGFSYGRAEGWGLDTMCASYSLGEPGWRALVRPWFDLVIDLLRDGQMDCTGIIQASYLGNVFNGQYRCRQSIEAAIVENAVVGMRESVFRGESAVKVTETNGVLERTLHAMISPLVWDSTDHGPWSMIADGPADTGLAPYCTYWPPDGNYNTADHYQVWSSYAYAYEITHDARFLDKAAEAMGGTDLQAMCQAMGANEIQNRAALLALVQTL
jgi:hypothetical protein